MGDTKSPKVSGNSRRVRRRLELCQSFFFVRGHWTIVAPPPSPDIFPLTSFPFSFRVGIYPLRNGSLAGIQPAIVPRRAQGRRRRDLPCSVAEIRQLDSAVEFPRNRKPIPVECQGTQQSSDTVARIEVGTAIVLRYGASRPRPHHAAQARRGVRYPSASSRFLEY